MADAKRLIGAVGIKVRPVTDGFRRDLQNDLRNLPDSRVNIKVDADTTEAKRKINRVKDDDTMTLRVGVTYDDIGVAQKRLDALLKNIKAKPIPVKLDEKGVSEALHNLAEIKKQSKVELKITEDEAGYAQVLAKIRAVQREKLEKTVNFKTDDASLAAEAEKYERLMEEATKPRTVDVTYNDDRDSMARALTAIEQEMQKIRAVKVPITADLASLENTHDAIQSMMTKLPINLKYNEDKAGYESVLKKIRSLRAEKIVKTIDLNLDEDKLSALEYEMEQKLDDLKEKAHITIEWSNDTFKMREALAKVDRAIADMSKVELDVEIAHDELYNTKKELERELGNTEFKVEFTEDVESLRKAKARVQELLNPITQQSMTVKPDEHSLKKSIEDIDEMIRKAEAKKIKIPVEPSQLAAAAAQLAWISRPRTVPLYVRVSEKSLAIAEGVLKSLSGYNTLTSMGRGLEKLVTNFDSIMVKTAVISTVIGALTNTLTYAGTALLGIGDGLSRSVGLLATGPAALTAVAAGVLVNIAAFKNFKSAIDGNAEALAALPENARAAAKALQGTWSEIQKPVQANYWEAMGTSLQDMVEVLLPQVRDGLANVSTHAGRFGSIVADTIRDIALTGAVTTTLSNLAGMFDTLTGAARPFTEAINTLGLRGSEYLPQFGTWVSDLAVRFNNFIQEADGLGRINQWIEEGVQSLKDMWRAGDGVIDILRGITGAAMDAGTNSLSTFADNMQRMGEIAQGEPFRSRLATIFEGARQGASELNVGVKNLGAAFGEAAPFIRDVLTILGQLGGTVLTNISKMFSGASFQGGIYAAFEGLRDMASGLLPSFQNIGNVIGGLGQVAKSTFTGLTPIINTVTGALSQMTDALEDELPGAAATLLAYMNNTFSALASLVVPVTEALGGLLEMFNDMPDGIQRALIAFGAFTIMRSQLASLFTTLAGTKAFKTMEQNWRMQQALAGNANAATQRFVATTALVGLGREKIVGMADGFRQVAGATSTAQQRMTGLMNAGKGLMGLMGGPWGLALGAAAIGLSLYGQKQAEAKAKVDAHTASLDEQTGAITKANAEMIAANLASDKGSGWFGSGAEGAAETIKNLGRSVQDTSQIVAKGGVEYRNMIDQIDRGIGAYKQAAGGVDELGRPIKGNTEAVEAWAKEMGIATDAVNAVDLIRLKDQLEAEHAAVDRSIRLWNTRNDSVKKDGAAGMSEGMAASIKVLGDAAGDAEKRLRAYRDILDELNGTSKSNWERQRELNSSYREMADFLGEVDAAGNRVNTGLVDLGTGFTIHTEAGGRFGQMLDDLQRQAQSAGQQAYDTAGGVKNAGEAAAAAALATQPYRDELQKLADQGLISQDEVNALSKALFGVPGSTPFELTDQNSIAAVSLKLGNLVNQIEATPNKEIIITEPMSPQVRKALENLGYTVENLPDGTIKVTQTGAELTGRIIDGVAEKKRTAPITAVAITDAAQNAINALTLTREAHIRVTAYDSQSGQVVRAGQNLWHADGGLYKSVGSGGAQTFGGLLGALRGASNVKMFANGGIERHVAQIAKPTSSVPMRIWAEAEPEGEAYIPLAASKRPRSVSILNQVAQQFGYSLQSKAQAFANGGIVGGGSTGEGVSVNIGSYVTQQSDSPDDVARALMRRIKAQGAYTPLEAF